MGLYKRELASNFQFIIHEPQPVCLLSAATRPSISSHSQRAVRLLLIRPSDLFSCSLGIPRTRKQFTREPITTHRLSRACSLLALSSRPVDSVASPKAVLFAVQFSAKTRMRCRIDAGHHFVHVILIIVVVTVRWIDVEPLNKLHPIG